MSITPEPTPEVENPDAEPETQIEGDDADEEEEQEEQTPAQAADAEGSAELIVKAEKENQRYHRALTKIFGEDPNRHDCPTCEGLGVVWGEVEPEVPLLMDDTLERCPKCNGRGERGTPSLVPEYSKTICLPCTGRGYVTKQIVPENLYTITPPPITAQQAQMGTMMPDGTFVPFVPNASTQPAQSYTP